MKKIVIVGIIAIMIGSVYAVYAGSSVTGDSNAQAFIGSICFKPGPYSDLHVLRIDQVGNALQVTGYNPVYPSAMDGGGAVVNGHLLLHIDEAIPAYAYWGVHSIDITLATMTGTDDLRWTDVNNNLVIGYTDLNYTRVPCPAPGSQSESGSTSVGK
ncbi:MAG: hypothetical protein O8C66_15050 [Candidatus Methanoperedens sp.]|nr:hypothetical protein [Candidatus Methanoperedens sp.]MCZ7371820.1 hypothetical protein [Candidatus Methanoperedens sp.]